MKFKLSLLTSAILLFVIPLVSAGLFSLPSPSQLIYYTTILFIISFIINLFLIWLVLKLLVKFKDFKKILLGTLIITAIGLVIDLFLIILLVPAILLYIPSAYSIFQNIMIILFFIAGVLLFFMYYLMAKYFFKLEKNKFWFALIMALLTNPSYPFLLLSLL